MGLLRYPTVGASTDGSFGRTSTWAVAIAALGAVGAVDYVTDKELGFYVFYFIPVALLAWRVGRPSAIVMSVCATSVWYASDTLSGHAYSSEWIRAWNSCVRLASFLAIGLTVARACRSLASERALNLELSHTLAEVRQLSGLLPICASCKKIRNDHGYWEQVEKFISNRTQADFTHSLCPDCEARLYPEPGPSPASV